MQEFPHTLSEYNEINSTLYKPINSTQRIKYTCFNTSPNYIILGSTSGSIYLFSRKPCSFVQLIPLSGGAVSHVLMSPDEKRIAVATIRGIVFSVALKPMPKLVAISTKHKYEQIKCLCWNDNSSEIYIGDGSGKVSVMVLSIFTVNGMFQGPACLLMNLDSAIVQLSFSSPLLLVSTLTRCYLCDTVQEQYKQVGNKARNGEFGACFYKTCLVAGNNLSVTHESEKLNSTKGSFSLILEGNSNVQEGNFPQIFCARPGSRLWEVTANGVVMKTHQFKEALAIPPAIICKPNITKIANQNQTEQTWLPQSINFSHLFVVAEKYLFSYTPNSIYIIDPVKVTIVLWSNEFSNISMAHTVENRIYLMTSDGEFHCLTLSFLDSLILRLYNRKKYYECFEICLLYKVQLRKLINSREINDICDMEDRLQMFGEDELSTLLRPLTLLLESNFKVCPKKLDSGIVVVHSGNSTLDDEESLGRKSMSRCSLQNIEKPRKLTAETEMLADLSINSTDELKKTEDKNCNVRNGATTNEVLEIKEELNLNKSPTQKIQEDLEAVYGVAGNMRLSMNEEELKEVIFDVDQRLNIIKDSYETLTDLRSFVYEVLRSAELYYFNALLENTSKQLIQSTNNKDIIKHVIKAFVSVNSQSYRRCTCGNPCPNNELIEPKFLGIGRSLLKKFSIESRELCIDICNGVPYMWREFLPVYMEQHDVLLNDSLRQCLQIRDSVVLSILLPSLDGKHWNLVSTYVKEMQEGQCLFCGRSTKKPNNETLINWTAVIYEIMKKQGPDFALTILARLEKALPNVPIDRSIFQSIVFTKILYQHGMKHVANFNKNALDSSEYNTMCSTQVQNQLVNVLEKDLGKPTNKNIFGCGAHHWGMHYKNKSPICQCCTLSLQTPVLLGNHGIAIFACGHAYHVNCMIEKKLTTCNLHS